MCKLVMRSRQFYASSPKAALVFRQGSDLSLGERPQPGRHMCCAWGCRTKLRSGKSLGHQTLKWLSLQLLESSHGFGP